MEHLTLTETEFFRLISNPDSRTGLRTAYDEFTQRVIQLCLIPPESGHPVHALSYAETELQYHEALQGRSHESELNLHVHKALCAQDATVPCPGIPSVAALPHVYRRENRRPSF